MKTNALNWFEIFTNDLEKSTEFYSTILATTLMPSEMEGCNMAMFPSDYEKGIGGAITKMDGCDPGPGGTLVYLNVEGDLDSVLERIPAAGGKVLRERFDISPHGFIAIFSDPEGNVVGLHSLT
ncbi:VOC family protein [Luteolibacter sp. AS25]|uniref:VOC family protein n=1 Tax=Luteolibacter sp. AS25 TaxID=3135776 RepID=UPI00398A6E68